MKLVEYLVKNTLPLERSQKCFDLHTDKNNYKVNLDLLQFLIESDTALEYFDICFKYYDKDHEQRLELIKFLKQSRQVSEEHY